MSAKEWVIRNPEMMDGLPVLEGTRIPVYVVLEMLEAGLTPEDIRRELPTLSLEHIRAALHYASQLCSQA